MRPQDDELRWRDGRLVCVAEEEPMTEITVSVPLLWAGFGLGVLFTLTAQVLLGLLLAHKRRR